MPASQQHLNPVAIDHSAAMQQQKLYQLHQQQLYLHQQHQMMMKDMKDPQLLMAYLQQPPSQLQPGPENISPQILQQQLRSYSPRAPSPISTSASMFILFSHCCVSPFAAVVDVTPLICQAKHQKSEKVRELF